MYNVDSDFETQYVPTVKHEILFMLVENNNCNFFDYCKDM